MKILPFVLPGAAILRASMKRLLLAGALVLPHAASLAATITTGPFVPSSTSPFIVPIVVSGAVVLDSFTFDLAWDPAAYQINTACDPFSDGFCDFVTGPITLGTFYTDATTFPSLFNPGFILLDGSGNQTGHLLGVNGAWQDFTPAPSGDGVLAFIEFIAVPGGSPTTPITVVGGSPDGNAVPEPAPILLICSALLLLGGRRGRRVWREIVPH